MVDHQFRNTSVYVRDENPGLWDPATPIPDTPHPPNGRAVGAPLGPCVQYIADHLEDIWAAPFGQQFFTDLANAGNRQVVKFIGNGVPNENACRGPGGSAAKRIRASFEGSDWSAARAELTHSLQAARNANPAHDMNWFATQLLTTPLHRWDPNATAPNSPLNPSGHAPGTPQFAGMRDTLAGLLEHYRSGTMSLRSGSDEHRELFDLIVIVLHNHLRNGNGGSSMIFFNPLKTHTAAGYRPPQCALFHELVHAYYNAQGSQWSNEDSSTENVGRYYELKSVGLTPFAARPYSENVMRGHMGHALRTQY